MPKRNWWGTDKDVVTRQEVAARPEDGDVEFHFLDEPFLVTTKKRPSKKDTKAWCRGKVGRPHVLVIDIPMNNYRQGPCMWRPSYLNYGTWKPRPELYYDCEHAELCSTCGKIFRRHYGWMRASPRTLSDEECPLYRPRP